MSTALIVVFALLLRMIIAYVFLPANAGFTADLEAFRMAEGVLWDGNVLGIYPEGTRSRDGKIGTFRDGAALLALSVAAGLAVWPRVRASSCHGDTERLALDMLDDGWLLAPGTLFQTGRRPSTRMGVNFAATQDGRFWRRLASGTPQPA